MKHYRKFKVRSAVASGTDSTVEANDIDIVQKSINSLLPQLKLSREDTGKAISGSPLAKLEKYLDIDIVELAKKESIPYIFFHLVIGEFSLGSRLSKKSSKLFDRAKMLLNDLDGNIYATDKVAAKKMPKINTKKMLFAAADRALKNRSSSLSAGVNWAQLKKADKELKVYLRVESFMRKITKLFPNRKFSSSGAKLFCTRFSKDGVSLKSKDLSDLEKEFGMVRTVEKDQISWLLVPSILYFTTMSNDTRYGKLSPLLSVVIKLDPKAVITKVGKLLKVFSTKLKSSRLDDAFEMLGKKCGATWKGRTGDNSDTLIWQTLHSLNT